MLNLKRRKVSVKKLPQSEILDYDYRNSKIINKINANQNNETNYKKSIYNHELLTKISSTKLVINLIRVL